jgi:hypothetical protein
MKTFQQFMSLCETGLRDRPGGAEGNIANKLGWSGGASITKTGSGGRVRPERKKTTPEIRRMKAVGGGKTEPVQYKPRKDIGTQRQASTRVQQPTQERGSADVKAKAAAAAKEERKKAALARIAAKKAGAKPEAAKPKAKEVEKQASKLLSTKKPEAPKTTPAKPRRKWEHEGGGAMTRAERDKARNKEKAEALKKRKAELIKDFTEKNGRAPKGKERTKLLGLAHGTVKAGV